MSGVPRFLRQGGRPLSLRFGTNESEGAEAFELAASAGVKQFIIGP